MQENGQTQNELKTEFIDTQKIVRALDKEAPDERLNSEESHRPKTKIFSSIIELLSYSFIVLLTNTILGTGLFFAIIVLTLWNDCPNFIWAGFLIFCLFAPLIIVFINVRLLTRISRKSSTTELNDRCTIREW